MNDRNGINVILPTWIAGLILSLASGASCAGDVTRFKTEHFDQDPAWDAHNNRLPPPVPPTVIQDFGYSPTSHAGRGPGEIGGRITPAAEAAYYAKVLPAATLQHGRSASGVIHIGPGGGHTLVGFFNSQTINEWRTPNTLALRINGRGRFFYAYVDFATLFWRAGGGRFEVLDPATGRKRPKPFPSGGTYPWSLTYDPTGNGGSGTITATLGDHRLVVSLAPDLKAEGALFDRCGLLNVMKAAGSPGTLWIDDLVVDGVADRLDRDPNWDGVHNRRTYTTQNVRPRFDFGFSPTHFAGGSAAGEIGGLIFRGDERFPDRMAYYGDRLETLALEHPLTASGRICFRRGVTDSTTHFGFFHSTDSMRPSKLQKSGIPENFLGIAIEGPSDEGFFFYPAYGLDRDGLSRSQPRGGAPHIYPDGRARSWTLDYSPSAADGRGRITLTLDGRGVCLDLLPGHRSIGAHFNRFGIITTHIDGNGQEVYLDDVTYTVRQRSSKP